jgi:hypothetical protein
MNRSTETQMPTQVAPVRVRVTRACDDDGAESAGNGDFVSAGLARLLRLRCKTDTTSRFYDGAGVAGTSERDVVVSGIIQIYHAIGPIH